MLRHKVPSLQSQLVITLQLVNVNKVYLCIIWLRNRCSYWVLLLVLEVHLSHHILLVYKWYFFLNTENY